MDILLLARLMGQYYFAGWRLSSSSSVTLLACGPASGRALGQTGGRHCTAGQYSYVPLGRHLVYTEFTSICIFVLFAAMHCR